MCNERSSEIHVWTNACREVYAQTFVQVLQRGTRTQLEFSTSKMPSETVTDANWAGELDGGSALDVVGMDLLW